MAKLILTDLASLANETTAIAAINNNNSAIETALENTLSRDGSTPNTMESSLDMNSNRIYNLPTAASNNEPVTLSQLASYSTSGVITINNQGPYILPTAAPFYAAGNGTADDTTELQAAITAALALVGNTNTSETVGQAVVIDLEGKAYKISDELTVTNASTGYGIVIQNGRLVADDSVSWSGKYMLKITGNVSHTRIINVHFDGGHDADVSCLLLGGAGSDRVVKDCVFQFFGAKGIHITGGVSARILNNTIGPQWNRTTDTTQYQNRSYWTAIGIQQDYNDALIAHNEIFGCITGMQFGSGLGATTGNTNTIIGNHPWCSNLDGVCHDVVNIRCYRGGNTFSDNYMDQGMIDLYAHNNQFYDNKWLINEGYGVGSVFRLFANSAGQTTIGSGEFRIEGGTLPAAMNTGYTVSGTTVNASTTVTLSTDDVKKINVHNRITGTGIPSQTYVTQILSSTTIQLSQAATTSATNTLTLDIPLIAFVDDGASTWNSSIRSNNNVLGNSQFTEIVGNHAIRDLRVDTGNTNGSVRTFARAGGPGAYIGFQDDATTTAPQIGSAGDNLALRVGGANEVQLSATSLYPSTDGGNSLGITTNGWQNIFLNTGATINIEAGNWLATHTAGILTVGTGDLRVTAAGTNTASVVTVGGTQTLSNKSFSGSTTFSTSSPFGSPASFTSTENSALPGPYLSLNRQRTGVAGDNLGVISFTGYDTANNVTEYAQMLVTIIDPTDGSEDGQYIFKTQVAGAYSEAAKFGNGVVIGAPTGGYKGVGTLNCAADIYKNNTGYTNPDYVFEHAYTGKIEIFAENEGAAGYQGLLSIDETREHTRATFKLPGFSDKSLGAFARTDILLEKLEEAYLHIFELHDRIAALEKRQ